MFIGYYKYRFKMFARSMLYNFLCRYKGIYVGPNCKLLDVKFNGPCKIKNDANLGPCVVLNKGTIIGGRTQLSNIVIGKNSHVEGGVTCTGYGDGKIIIGDECYIGINNILDWSDNITIGNFVQIAGPSTALWTHFGAKMCINSIPLNKKNKINRPTAPIIIENNVYIGGNCTIYPGVTIGHHSIVAPNSAVDKSVEPFSMVGGVPAKFIKKIVIE